MFKYKNSILVLMNDSQVEKYKGKGLTGLANLGNTCFINSCMQILSHTYMLNDFLDKEDYKKKLNKKPESVLLMKWDKLRTLMWSENCTINPAGWVQAVQKIARIKGRDLFTGFAQNDLPEFLLFIIDSFHSALMREVEMNIKGTAQNSTDKLAKECYEMMKNMYKKEYSEILGIFYGIHVSQIASLDGKEIKSYSPEPYFMVDLAIDFNSSKTLSLYDCFDNYYDPEKLEGDNGWFNEETNQKEDVTKGFIFWSFPEVLVIALKRFNNMNRKNQRLVTFPLENLDLRKYVKGYDKESYIYDLYGVCNHSGGSLGGHYTAYVKNANSEWYLFNDTSITKIPSNLEGKIVSPQAYCFFYKKKNK